MTIMAGAITGLLLAGLATAQQGQINGPISGYVFDKPARALRPVLGIPGASVLGDPVKFPFEVATVYVAPRQDAAIVVAADRSVHVFKLNAGTAAEVAANGISAAPDGVAFSPSGTAAALYSAGRAQVITGLPDAPVPAGTVDSRAGQQGALSVRPHPHRSMAPEMFAVSDDGAIVLAATDGAVRALQSGGGDRSLMDSAGAASIAFAPGGHDAVVASPSGGLTVLRDVAGAAEQQALAPAADVDGADGVAFSADGKTVYVARAKGGVAVFDVATKGRTDVTCDCVPFGLTPMGSLFRLNEAGAGPIWLLDTVGGRIVFVPAKSSL